MAFACVARRIAMVQTETADNGWNGWNRCVHWHKTHHSLSHTYKIQHDGKTSVTRNSTFNFIRICCPFIYTHRIYTYRFHLLSMYEPKKNDYHRKLMLIESKPCRNESVFHSQNHTMQICQNELNIMLSFFQHFFFSLYLRIAVKKNKWSVVWIVIK